MRSETWRRTKEEEGDICSPVKMAKMREIGNREGTVLFQHTTEPQCVQGFIAKWQRMGRGGGQNPIPELVLPAKA